MRQSWFISDLHFGHPNILKYQEKERPFASPELLEVLKGTEKFRPGSLIDQELQATIHTHNQHIVDVINEYVTKRDTLWILGDVSFRGDEHLNYVHKIICENKNLVLGNHDLQPVGNYVSAGFTKVCGMVSLKEFVLTHAPIHPCQLSKRYSANIHGHLHTYDVDDPRYVNVNIDRLEGMKPLSLQDIRDRIKNKS